MRTTPFHFPFLFWLSLGLLLFSCTKEIDESKIINPTYKTSYTKAEVFNADGQFDSAYYYYNKAKLSCSSDEVKRKVYVLIKMSEIQNQFCDYTGSQENITEAFKIIGKDTTSLSSLHNLLGITYKETFDYKKALSNYSESKKYSKKELDQIILLNNTAVVHLEQKYYANAIAILTPLLNNDTLVKNPMEWAKVADNLGYAYFKAKDEKALPFLNKALQLRDSLKNDLETTASLMHLSEFYALQNPKLSTDYAVKAYQSATRANNPDDRLEALDFLIKNATGNEFKSYYSIHSALNDSIIQVRQTAKNQFANIKYNAATSVQELELQKTKNYLFIVLLVFVSGLASFIIVTIRKRNREKIKSISYETETRISKKIHDELANDVFNALTYAETQNLSDLNKKETLLENLDQIYARTRNISRENSAIDTGEDYPKHLIHLLTQYDSNSVNVIIHKITSIDWNLIKKETKIGLYRVLQELMVNMKKHSNCSVVMLRFEHQKSQIIVHYADNGKGVEMLKSKKGLQNAENRILAINGTITFESEPEKGFKATVVIPK